MSRKLGQRADDGRREAGKGSLSVSVSEATEAPSPQNRPPSRTDGGNGDSDRGDKQRGEIWRQEEAGSQNKSRGSRGMRTG